MDSRHRTAEQRDDPSIKAWPRRSLCFRHRPPKARTCSVPGCRLEVVLPPPKEHRLVIVIGPLASSSGTGRSGTVGQAESNVTTREHSLPSIATLEDEGEDEDEYEEDKDMEEGDEDEDWDDEDWEAEGEEEDEEEEP